MTPERLAEIERILCGNATWWREHAVELVAEVRRLQARPLLQLVKKISAERDAARAEVESLAARLGAALAENATARQGCCARFVWGDGTHDPGCRYFSSAPHDSSCASPED